MSALHKQKAAHQQSSESSEPAPGATLTPDQRPLPGHILHNCWFRCSRADQIKFLYFVRSEERRIWREADADFKAKVQAKIAKYVEELLER
jgi:hypothetical protein